TAAPPGRVRGHGRRARERAADRPPARWTRVGRVAARSRSDVLLLPAERRTDDHGTAGGGMKSGLKRVLYAEDSPQDGELTLASLDQHNVANEVVVVRDGAEAWDYLCAEGAYANRVKGNPAVVLLDLKMPKLDGLEVLRRMRAHDGMRTIPVVMLTS